MGNNILRLLVILGFKLFYILSSALFINWSVHSFKEEKYFQFGVDIMLALSFVIPFVELCIENY